MTLIKRHGFPNASVIHLRPSDEPMRRQYFRFKRNDELGLRIPFHLYQDAQLEEMRVEQGDWIVQGAGTNVVDWF